MAFWEYMGYYNYNRFSFIFISFFRTATGRNENYGESKVFVINLVFKKKKSAIKKVQDSHSSSISI